MKLLPCPFVLRFFFDFLKFLVISFSVEYGKKYLNLQNSSAAALKVNTNNNSENNIVFTKNSTLVFFGLCDKSNI